MDGGKQSFGAAPTSWNILPQPKWERKKKDACDK